MKSKTRTVYNADTQEETILPNASITFMCEKEDGAAHRLRQRIYTLICEQDNLLLHYRHFIDRREYNEYFKKFDLQKKLPDLIHPDLQTKPHITFKANFDKWLNDFTKYNHYYHHYSDSPTNACFTGALQLILFQRPGDCLYLEMPETGVHPSKLHILAKLISILARNNIKVFIYSNCFLFLNEFRILIKEGFLKNTTPDGENDFVCLFSKYTSFSVLNKYEEEEIRQTTQIVPIYFDQNGCMEYWPDGFMDTIDIQHDKLLF